MIWPMLRSTCDHYLKKIFSKLDFLKTVSVTMTANSEQILYFFSPLSFCRDDFLRNWTPPTQFFGIHRFPTPSKKEGGLETMRIYLKIYEIISASFYVFTLEHFECVYCCLPFLIWFFVKIFAHFYNQIKHKAGNRFYTSNKNNKSMETLQTKQT